MTEHKIYDIIDSFDTQISTELPTEWAEKNRILTSDITSFPGPMNYDRFPYWKEPVNTLSPDHPMRLLSIMGGSQIGKSTGFIETGIGYYIKNNPCPMVMTVTDKEMSNIAVTKKIDQMLNNSGISHLIRANQQKKNNRRTGDTNLMKEFPGGSLMFFSIKAVDKIGRQNSFRVGFFDDLESAVRSQKFAGDIIDLVLMRFNSYKDTMKACFISTPEIKQTSVIEPAFQNGDQRYYFMPCPKCGAYINFIWHKKVEGTNERVGVYFEKDNHGRLINKSVGYVCQECGGFFEETHKRDMLANGIWKPTEEPSRPDWYSYHISGLYSPPGFYDWKHHANQWIKIFKNDTTDKRKLQVFLNLVLGQTYEEQGKAPKISQLAQNTRQYKIYEVPSSLSEKDGNGKIIMLTCACDLNGKIDDARLDYEVIAHSETGCTYSIDSGSIGTFQRGLDHVSRELWTYRNNEKVNNVWDIFLTEVLQKPYKSDNGKVYNIFICGVDTGNFTHYAYSFIDTYQYEGVPLMLVGIKGDVKKVRKLDADTSYYHNSKERENLYLLEVNQLKDIVADRIEMVWNEDSGLSQPVGFMNFPMPENGKYLYKSYFKQYEAEHKIPKLNADGSEVGYTWQKKYSTIENHFFDCAVYTIALRDIFVESFLKAGKYKEISWGKFCEVVKKVDI